MSEIQYYSIYQGEARDLPLRLENPDRTPFDLTGFTAILCRFKKQDGQALEISSVLADGAGIVAPNPTSGRFLVSVDTTQSALLKEGERQDFTVIVHKGARATSTYGAITFEAKYPGKESNSVVLLFDGVKTIGAVLDEWNLKNADLAVKLTSADPLTTVPAAGSATFSGGTSTGKRICNFYRALNVIKKKV